MSQPDADNGCSSLISQLSEPEQYLTRKGQRRKQRKERIKKIKEFSGEEGPSAKKPKVQTPTCLGHHLQALTLLLLLLFLEAVQR